MRHTKQSRPRRKTFLPVTVRVRAEGTLHEVRLTRKGQLVFVNHSREEIRRYVNYEAIGGDPGCRCATIYYYWCLALGAKQGAVARERLPKALRKAALRCLRDKRKRRRKPPRCDELALGIPLHERPRVLARLIDRALRKRWPLGRGLRVAVVYRPGGEYLLRFHLPNRRTVQTVIQAVYQQGKHFDGDALVLQVDPRSTQRPFTLACRLDWNGAELRSLEELKVTVTPRWP
jgi:hypothetical protein